MRISDWSSDVCSSDLFAPLRFMPKGKRVVLGLMSSKRPAVEGRDYLRQRIDEAARYVALEQCALSHQCGFSSTAHGNELAEDDKRSEERRVGKEHVSTWRSRWSRYT